MTSQSPEPFDAFAEVAKAFMEVVLGPEETTQIRHQMTSYSDLIDENNRLQAEVASLRENLPFKSKYENLQVEFRKVAAERDSLRAQELEVTRIRNDYEKCKSAYQQVKGQLATVQKSLEEGKSSITPFSALECLYQAFKETGDKNGVDVRRIPTKVGLQFTLQNGSNQGLYWEFLRTSATNWKRTK
jgi:predicted RNase H-like nuclease (RuvC/YqgF family)